LLKALVTSSSTSAAKPKYDFRYSNHYCNE